MMVMKYLIGNLIEDKAEGLLIDWNLQGKVKKITKSNIIIYYFYDAMGNRIGKAFTENSQTTFARYVGDSRGNAYCLENGSNAPQPTLNTLYGVTPELAELNIDFETYSTICGFSIDFEDQYTALIHWTNPTPTTSYLCLGSFTKAPETGNAGYRYGFNGKEKDNEVKGKGNSYDFGARMYDSRLGRWLSLDPLKEKYPDLNPYNFVANSPIYFIDPDGKIIKPNGGAAKDALQAHFQSFGSMDNVRVYFNLIETRLTNKFSSIDRKKLGRRAFNRRIDDQLKLKGGITLNIQQRRAAYSTYLALRTSQIIEIDILLAADPMSINSGEQGTYLINARSGLNQNSGLLLINKDINATNDRRANSQIVNEAVNPQNPPGRYSPDFTGPNYGFYGPSTNQTDLGIDGTIVINGTNQTDQQNTATISNAIQTVYP